MTTNTKDDTIKGLEIALYNAHFDIVHLSAAPELHSVLMPRKKAPYEQWRKTAIDAVMAHADVLREKSELSTTPCPLCRRTQKNGGGFIERRLWRHLNGEHHIRSDCPVIEAASQIHKNKFST